MEAQIGFEPMTAGLQNQCSTTELQCLKMERAARIELASLAWKAKVIPLYDARTSLV